MFNARELSSIGKPVFITEYVRQHGRDDEANGTPCFCGDCKQPVHTYVSEAYPERNHFAHFPKTPDTPECRSRMGGTDPWRGYFHDSERRQENADRIRSELKEPKTFQVLLAATNAMLRISRVQPIDRNKFSQYLQRAEDLKLLEHSKIRGWTVPFLILSLGDFTSGRDNIRFHFDRRPHSKTWVLMSARVHPDGSAEGEEDFKVERETVVRLYKGPHQGDKKDVARQEIGDRPDMLKHKLQHG